MPTPSPAPTPVPGREPAPTPPVAVAPAPLPGPSVAAPPPVTGPSPSLSAPVEGAGAWSGYSLAAILGVMAGAALFGLAWFLLRRRRRSSPAAMDALPFVEPAEVAGVPPEEPPVAPRPAPAPPAALPPLPASPASDTRAQIEFDLVAMRAGTNAGSLSADIELVIGNAGLADAHDVRLFLSLITASERQNAELTAIFEGAAGQPVVAPFALAIGREEAIRATVSIPLDRANRIPLEGREMVVPIVAIRVAYRWGERGEGMTAHSFVLGVEPPGLGKMRPIWVDGGARMFDRIAVRPNGLPLRR